MIPTLIFAVHDFKSRQPERHIAILALQPFNILVHIPAALANLFAKGIATHQHHFDVRIEPIDDQLAG